MKTTTSKTKKRFLIIPAVLVFAIVSVYGFSIFTGNKQQSNIGSSKASAQEPADFNNDNVVNVFDLSYLLGKWNTNDTTADLNTDGTVNVFDLSRLLSKWGAVAAAPSSELYGTAFNMDAVGNLQVGGDSYSSTVQNTYASIRFRAEHSGPLDSVRVYWVGMQSDGSTISGYAGGNGGTIQVSIRNDNGGVPSGSSLATMTHIPYANRDTFHLLSFPSPANLTAGSVYHVVFTNTDPSPRVNFISINGTWTPNDMYPRQPKFTDTEYAMLAKYDSSPWEVRQNYTGVIDLGYRSGAHQGQGYMEVDIYDGHPIISGSSYSVRERFTVSGGNRTVSGGAIRIAKSYGSGSIVARLEDASGSLIDSFTITASSVPTIAENAWRSEIWSSGDWVTGSFSSPRTLVNGTTYNLRLTTNGSTSYWVRGIQQGSGWGMHSSTAFSDGFMQYTTDGGSSWSEPSGLGYDGDIQFYLE